MKMSFDPKLNYKNATDFFKSILSSGVANLVNNTEYINKINVFPIPDADTGTNMAVTAISGLKAIQNQEFIYCKDIFQTFADGLLMSAQGNSGTIFAQMLRGFSKALRPKQSYLTDTEFYKALYGSYQYAYRAVSDPVEGTMLSLVKYAAKTTPKKLRKENRKNTRLSAETALKTLLDDLEVALKNTPNELPILKESGVVDSGSQGLYSFFEGVYLASIGQQVKLNAAVDKNVVVTQMHHLTRIDYSKTMLGYCVEFIVQFFSPKSIKKTPSDDTIKSHLESLGCNSIVLIRSGNILKIHTHTFKPHSPTRYLNRFGEFLKVKIENMTLQNQHNQSFFSDKILRAFKKEVKLLAVFNESDKWLQIIEKLPKVNIDILAYKKTVKNLSSVEILNAIHKTKAINVVVMTNSQSANLLVEKAIKLNDSSDQKCVTVPFENMGMLYGSLLEYHDFYTGIYSEDLKRKVKSEKVVQVLKKSKKQFKCIQVLKAHNPIKRGHLEVEVNHYYVEENNRITKCDSSFKKLLKQELTDHVNEEDDSSIIVIAEKEAQKSDTKWLESFVMQKFPELEFYLKKGGQEGLIYTILVRE